MSSPAELLTKNKQENRGPGNNTRSRERGDNSAKCEFRAFMGQATGL